MADLPIGVFDHRVIFAGASAYVIGGRKVDGALTNRRTWRITGGLAAPVEIGLLNQDHVATNNSQGMAILRSNGKIHAMGNGNLAQNNIDILDPVTGLWSPSAAWVASFYGGSPTWAYEYVHGNHVWLPWGIVGDASTQPLVLVDGSMSSAGWSGAPMAPTRPFRQVIFNEGKWVWVVMGANGGGAPRLVKLDTQSAGPGYYTPYNAVMDASYGSQWGSYTYLENSFFWSGDHLVIGGQENNAGASNKVWRINVMNPLVPVVVACAPMPRKRRHHTSHELYNGLVAVIGGVDETGAVIDAVDLYHPDLDKWYTGPKIPYGAVCKHSSAVSPNTGNVLCVGGNTNFLGNACSNAVAYLRRDGFAWIEGDWI